MRAKFLFFFFLSWSFSFLLHAQDFEKDREELAIKRVYALMQIRDYSLACEEGRRGVERFPRSQLLWEAYLKALAKSGDEKYLLNTWNRFIRLFPEAKEKDTLLEEMAWCIIEKGSRSPSPVIRATSLLAAFFSQEVKGVAIIDQCLEDPSSFIRAIAVKLASEMRDERLRHKVFLLFQNETTWNVHLEAIKAVGSMKIFPAKPLLGKIIADDQRTMEEKKAAIQSLVNLVEAPQRDDVKKLVLSERAGLRLLACQLVAFFGLSDDLDVILPLRNDSCAEVRAAFFQTLGILHTYPKSIPAVQLARGKLDDQDPTVAIIAAWALTLHDPKGGQKAFQEWLAHEDPEVRLFAAAALAHAGQYGLPLTLETFKKTSEPYVRLNLALSLVGQRKEETNACEGIYRCLTQIKEKWMWEEKGIFRFIAPSTVKYDEVVPQYPEAVNQLTRLEVLNLLAIMRYPKAQEAIKAFLQERNWGITSLAASLLLTEGDETAVHLVEDLLNDPNSKICVQAALILALWSEGEKALPTLEGSYRSASREIKERILEGILQTHSKKSIPFLVERLQEPSQSIRIIAAAALLQCLYH